MSTNGYRNPSLAKFTNRVHLQRGLIFGVIIITALFAFEVFNYSTTEFALSDLLGDLEFLGLRWATILAIAFCGIDFAGIARLFTPESGSNKSGNGPSEAWYLFGAWLLAATMNAMLTWWGVSLAILEQQELGNMVVSRETLLRAVPIFVAVLVWLIRVLIIGTFSVAGDRLFSQDDQLLHGTERFFSRTAGTQTSARSLGGNSAHASRSASAASNNYRPAPKPTSQAESGYSRQEPTYHSLSMTSARQNSSNSEPSTSGQSTYKSGSRYRN
jgi:hypothetical protein